MVSWIQTFSGKAIDPLEPNPAALDIIDVAHALSHVNRYTGHTFKPYSVALHSLTVAHLVKMRGESRATQLWALLHDATEAYLSDIAAPVKQHDVFAGYREAERRLSEVICDRFMPHTIRTGYVWSEMAAKVKQADRDMLLAERRNILPKGAWVAEPAPSDAQTTFAWGKNLGGPLTTRAAFLMLFDALGGVR